MVEGVTEGFTVLLRLSGVGYRAAMTSDGKLELKLGYPNPPVTNVQICKPGANGSAW